MLVLLCTSKVVDQRHWAGSHNTLNQTLVYCECTSEHGKELPGAGALLLPGMRFDLACGPSWDSR